MEATDHGQTEAVRTPGFSARETFRMVTLPQMLHIAKPDISCAEADKTAKIEILCGGASYDPFSQEDDAPGVTILKNIAQEITYNFEEDMEDVPGINPKV